MPKTIYHWENGNSETWIYVNDDGTVTHHVENAGWTAYRIGSVPRDHNMSAEEAKQQWPAHAEKIDAALSELGQRQTEV